MKLYSRLKTKETICEFWGGSTKHPDVIYNMQADIEKKRFITIEPDKIHICDILQWLMYIASRQTFIFHAIPIIKSVQDYYTAYYTNGIVKDL